MKTDRTEDLINAELEDNQDGNDSELDLDDENLEDLLEEGG